MSVGVMGWDIGGAHIKAAVLDREGKVLRVIQRPCPLWQSLEHLHRGVAAILKEMPEGACLHALTMTGELVDLFPDRHQGIRAILGVMKAHLPKENLRIYAGSKGWLGLDEIGSAESAKIASANWLASASFAACHSRSGLLVDIGSTTTDIVVMGEGQVKVRGYDDYQRLQYEELVYTGVVRTPVMAIADRAPFGGEWIGLMAEHFATMADVYRLLDQLPGYADQMPAADGGEKTREGSARRLARMLGRDFESAPLDDWRRAAEFLREQQLMKIRSSCERQLSRGLLAQSAPFVGAGVGRFLVETLAQRLGFPYVDFMNFFPLPEGDETITTGDCAPAVAVACLALQAF